MDPVQTHVEALARRVAAEADDVHGARRQLLATGDVDWSGTGAARFRARLDGTGHRVGALALACAEAADGLRAHARAHATAPVQP
ncbi:hypothetical protein [Kineococcus sp. SYSU DK001]|uniref:hypothetical protein n=1 Tax=Kineococcus sp. SYSU DK001 TaxID=3383122 RepID=UPI003D7EA2E2